MRSLSFAAPGRDGLRWLLVAGCLIAVALPGCGRTPEGDSPQSPAEDASVADRTSAPLTGPEAIRRDDPPSLTGTAPAPTGEPQPGTERSAALPSTTQIDSPSFPLADSALGEDELGNAAADDTAPPAEDEVEAESIVSDRIELPADLTPEQLVDFLRDVDHEMRNVTSGRRGMLSFDEANAELKRLARLKLRAAEALQEQSQPETRRRGIAVRGILQSLSHLAASGDVAAAEKLEKIAGSHAEDPDPDVALDSRLVLIGLAMERLQHGGESASEEVLRRIGEIAAAPRKPDVSALMVMGQARAVLQQYGYNEAAEQVRATILNTFVDHPDPEVSRMAVEAAGAANLTAIHQLLRDFQSEGTLDEQRWVEAVETAWEQSRDAATVQLLVSAATHFEAVGLDSAADATLEILGNTDDLEPQEADIVATAIEARKNRGEIIGKPAEVDLPSVDGRPLTLSSWQGRVVLMPFWGISFPESLSVLQALDRIREQHEGKVEIIGINLDPEDAPAEEFLRQSPIPFRSFRSIPEPPGHSHEVARTFGVTTLPFVVIVDAQGRVAGINMAGQGIAEQVEKLVGEG